MCEQVITENTLTLIIIVHEINQFGGTTSLYRQIRDTKTINSNSHDSMSHAVGNR